MQVKSNYLNATSAYNKIGSSLDLSPVSNSKLSFDSLVNQSSFNENPFSIKSSDATGLSKIFKDALAAGRNNLRLGEVNSNLSLENKGNLSDMALALNQADITLQTITAVRDKAINAYNDIMKMNI